MKRAAKLLKPQRLKAQFLKAQLLSVLLCLLLLLAVAGVVAVRAQEGGGYDLSWWTVDGGGAKVQGGGFTLVGTTGQPDASATLEGSGYSLVGGFWAGAGGARYRIYVPVVMRGYAAP
jgi:hypothetical protein